MTQAVWLTTQKKTVILTPLVSSLPSLGKKRHNAGRNRSHVCVCVRVCVHGHIRIKKMKEWSNHILFLLLFFLSMCPKLFVKADLLYHVYPFQQELLTVRVQGNGYTHYCLTQLLTVHVWENGYTHYCRTQHKINLKKLIIIIIMCNSYIVPNPTRLAQALHNSKRE